MSNQVPHCSTLPDISYSRPVGPSLARSSRSPERDAGDLGSSRPVIRDESTLAHVDWLSFTVVPPPSVQRLPWLQSALLTLFNLPPDSWRPLLGGWQGYKHRIDLGDFGLLAFGGEHQRGTCHVSVNAKACASVVDWQAVRVWGETYSANITRVDLAHDDFDGETVTVDAAIGWWRAGGFRQSGRPPKAHLRDDLGSQDGRTLYVGRRVNGKLCRVYEKGKALGDVGSPWVRIEVELRKLNRLIPWDVVIRPGQYLAGAYPCLRWLSLNQSKVVTTQRIYDISYESMCAQVRLASGRALNVMCDVEGGDSAEVLARVVRAGAPKRLRSIPQPRNPAQ